MNRGQPAGHGLCLYDALNRMTEMVDASSYPTVMAYDDRDQPTLFRDARGLDTTTAYNGFGEPVAEVSPDRGTRTYAYDSRGLLAQMTDGRGSVTTYAYDNGGRLTARSYPSQPALNQTFTYWADPAQPWSFGQLHIVTDQAGQTVRSYLAANGQLARDQRDIGAVSYPVDYAWTVRGEIDQMTYPSGARLFFSYDANGNLHRLEWQGIDPVTRCQATRQTDPLST